MIDIPLVRATTLADGRTLTWQEFGALDGEPVLYFHGGGSTSLEGGLFDRDARARGLRLIATNRPGALESSLRPGRPVARYADDLDELLDELGVGDFACLGESNGGMVALAVAATMGARVRGAVPINPTLPWRDPEARRTASRSTAVGYRMLRWTPRLVAAIDRSVARRRGRTAFDAVAAARTDDLTGPPPGIEQDEGELHHRIMVERAGTPALLAELAWASGDWGFDYTSIAAPLDFFCGVHDAQAGFARVLAERNPDARFHTFAHGHNGYSHPDARRRILDAVAGHLDRRRTS